jgi:hypothetical protein
MVLIREAEERTASVDRTGFRWAKHPYAPVVMGALSSPEARVNVIRAHVLTGDPKFLRAAVLACQTGAGANPVNLCYTTGTGSEIPSAPAPDRPPDHSPACALRPHGGRPDGQLPERLAGPVYRAFLGRRDLPTRTGMAGTRGLLGCLLGSSPFNMDTQPTP